MNSRQSGGSSRGFFPTPSYGFEKDPLSKYFPNSGSSSGWGSAGFKPSPIVSRPNSPAPSGGGGGSSGPAHAPAPAPAPQSGPSAMDIMAAIMEAQRRAREEAYNKAMEAQRKNHEFAQGQVNDATEKALQEAYINKMQTIRNFQQQLSAQGLNGGASETVAASLHNNYGNARNDLENERQKQLADLLNTFQNNAAKLEAQRASGEAASLSQFMPALMRLAATNNPLNVSMTQASPADVSLHRFRQALGLEEEDY